MSDIEVIQGEPVQRASLRGLAADEVARMLGHKVFHGVQVRPDVVVVLVAKRRKLTRHEHPITGGER